MEMEKLRAYYEHAFNNQLESSSTPVSCSSSLLEWTKNNFPSWRKEALLSAIELGCGPKSILEELFFPANSQCFAIDFSQVMIDHARSHSSHNVVYECWDVLALDTHPLLKDLDFDLVVDGHLFHCLTDQKMREKYLSLVLQKLSAKNGSFILECMVETDTLSFADDFLFLDDSRVLLQQIGRDTIPVRYIPTVELLLNQFAEAGFEIRKFICPPGWKIISDARRMEPIDGDPGLARFLLFPSEQL